MIPKGIALGSSAELLALGQGRDRPDYPTQAHALLFRARLPQDTKVGAVALRSRLIPHREKPPWPVAL